MLLGLRWLHSSSSVNQRKLVGVHIEVRFDALAPEHTELVCGMNLAIMTGVTEQLQETSLVARKNLSRTAAVLSWWPTMIVMPALMPKT
jgi:biotin-(acetyl-CoA carboxylase) ligase